MSDAAAESSVTTVAPETEAPAAEQHPPFEPVPLWRWGIWYSILAVAIVVFYVVLTPLWLGLRGLAWAAEFRSRREA
jgi:hypothetical protein